MILTLLGVAGGWLKQLWAVVMSIASKVNLQGWIGLAASLLLWIHFGGAARHWHKQATQFEQLFRAEKAAFATTVANYRAAQVKADQLAAANVVRVETEQRKVLTDRETSYESRIADARARADRLRAGASSTHPGGANQAGVSGVSTATGVGQASAQGGLSTEDALIATEQAIELDELIKAWQGVAKVKPTP